MKAAEDGRRYDAAHVLDGAMRSASVSVAAERDAELFQRQRGQRPAVVGKTVYRQLSKGTHDDIRFSQGAETRRNGGNP